MNEDQSVGSCCQRQATNTTTTGSGGEACPIHAEQCRYLGHVRVILQRLHHGHFHFLLLAYRLVHLYTRRHPFDVSGSVRGTVWNSVQDRPLLLQRATWAHLSGQGAEVCPELKQQPDKLCTCEPLQAHKGSRCQCDPIPYHTMAIDDSSTPLFMPVNSPHGYHHSLTP